MDGFWKTIHNSGEIWQQCGDNLPDQTRFCVFCGNSKYNTVHWLGNGHHVKFTLSKMRRNVQIKLYTQLSSPC